MALNSTPTEYHETYLAGYQDGHADGLRLALKSIYSMKRSPAFFNTMSNWEQNKRTVKEIEALIKNAASSTTI